MAFSGKMQNRTRLILFEQARHQFAVTNIAMHEMMTRIIGQRSKVVGVAGIGQFVEINNRLVAASQPVEHKIRAYETRTTRHKNHLVSRCKSQISRKHDFM